MWGDRTKTFHKQILSSAQPQSYTLYPQCKTDMTITSDQNKICKSVRVSQCQKNELQEIEVSLNKRSWSDQKTKLWKSPWRRGAYLGSEGKSHRELGAGGCSGPGDGVPGRLVAQDSAAELHRLPQGGGQVVLLPAVEDRRQVSNGAALLHLHLLVPDCSGKILFIILFQLKWFLVLIILASNLIIVSIVKLTLNNSEEVHNTLDVDTIDVGIVGIGIGLNTIENLSCYKIGFI